MSSCAADATEYREVSRSVCSTNILLKRRKSGMQKTTWRNEEDSSLVDNDFLNRRSDERAHDLL